MLMEALGGDTLDDNNQSILYYQLNKVINTKKLWWRTYSVIDPRDNEAVKLGVEYYYKL